ncbi:MAG TPA: vitamin K epoxide reductase family protein, partial [Gemmatimonadota bacterium]|nr:vitamin K epoxide reductase family protein [Gemmatimonadota bacterium]
VQPGDRLTTAPPEATASRAPLWVARFLALVGFLDAAYLTASHFADLGLACGPGGGCEAVTTSRWATVGSVPIAAIGLGYYAMVNLIVWTPATNLTRGVVHILLALTGAALAVSVFLFYLQAAVIEAWCRYCLLSAVVTLLLFLSALALRRSTPPD